ncbi:MULTISPECIES: hypothetical protein [Paenibacillus]|uniref:hypothetical protein n=1 Tax=Paenibacillus TaxID=44249 RepID=UPI00038FF920|nr:MULTISPECIES: hypothetical protein [Paenibacillus]CDN41965.1 Predicted protein [Paenibacillus sp. P22]
MVRSRYLNREVSLLFELHELLSWIWSIGIVCSAAYYYFAWFHDAVQDGGWRPSGVRFAPPGAPKSAAIPSPLRLRLVRLSKRKDSPDDDGADCLSLFQGRSANEWGGYYSWTRTRTADSRLRMR